MDPITTAILAALTAGALSGLSETGKTAIADGYSTLKSLLVRKHGTRSTVAQAIDSLEAEPASSDRQAVLREVLAAVNADQDILLLGVAQHLSALVHAQQPDTGKFTIQNIAPIQQQNIGDHNINIQVQSGKNPRDVADEKVGEARGKVRQHGERRASEGMWDWHLLGHALQFAHEANDKDPCYQRPWTLLADIYHRIGKIQLAQDCLKRSYNLATPGPNSPGNFYREVKGHITSGYPFDSVGGLQREQCPQWFEDKYQRYWNLDAKLNIKC